MDLVGRLVPPTTHEEQVAALLDAQAYLHSLGVTGWQDAILGDYANLTDSTPAYVELATPAASPPASTAPSGGNATSAPNRSPHCWSAGNALQFPRLRAGSVKIMQDGVAENFTAGMLDPYYDGCGCRTANAACPSSTHCPSRPRNSPRRRRIPGPCACDRRSRSPRSLRCVRGGDEQPTATCDRATTSPTCRYPPRRHRPFRRARRRRQTCKRSGRSTSRR